MAERRNRTDRLADVIKLCRADVESGPRTSSLSQAPDRLLGTLARKAGYQRVSSVFCSELDAGLRAEGIKTFPNLTERSNTRTTRIYLFAADDYPAEIQHPSVLLDSEKELSLFLRHRLHKFPQFKKMGLHNIKPEKIIGPGCKIDLLAEEKKTGTLVGIELKTGAPPDRLVNQAGRYMEALKNRASEKGHPGARLIIVTGQPDPEIQARIRTLATAQGVPVQWFIYAASMTVKEIHPR